MRVPYGARIKRPSPTSNARGFVLDIVNVVSPAFPQHVVIRTCKIVKNKALSPLLRFNNLGCVRVSTEVLNQGAIVKIVHNKRLKIAVLLYCSRREYNGGVHLVGESPCYILFWSLSSI